MAVIKTNIKTTSVYSDDNTKRYSMNIEWDREKKKATVIMVSAGASNGISFDHTTTYVIDNLYRLGYGSVKVVNLFATIGDGHAVLENDTDDNNMKYIINAVKESDITIYATGTGHNGNRKFRRRQEELLHRLEAMDENMLSLMCIADEYGRKFFHPLYPAVREWILVPFKVSELLNRNTIEGVDEGDV